MDIPSHAQIIEAIDAFRLRHGIAESRFGREATGEPGLLGTLRGGRDPSIGTLQRIAAYMAGIDSPVESESEHVRADISQDHFAASGKSGAISAQAVTA